jgi:hypothetical protein
MKTRSAIGLFAILVGLATCSRLSAQDASIPLMQLPAEVHFTMDNAVPGARYTQAVLKHEFARNVFELTGKTAGGRDLRLVVSESGSVLAVNTPLPPTEVPATVTSALNRWVKGFQSKAIERSVRDSGTRIWYRFQGKNDRGKLTQVDIREDGKQLMIEEE